MGEERVVPLFLHGSDGSDVAVIEGVMGLFDGKGDTDFASTAHVARLLNAPVVLVVDAAKQSRSVAALVHGFATFDPRVRFGGVILNRIGSDRHEELCRAALGEVPVLGAIRRDDAVETPSRHLGLIPAAEREAEALAAVARLGELMARSCDLDALARLAATAPPLHGLRWTTGRPSPTVTARPVVAVAGGAAFTFDYAEHVELLRACGADVAVFDPLRDERLPEGTGAIVIGGGFPELYVAELAANQALCREIEAFDGPIAAECAGLLYLGEELDGRRMCGRIPARARMTAKLTLGYREAVAGPSLLTRPGERYRGHEFHRTTVDPPGSLFGELGGYGDARLTASYLHLHWAGAPKLAQRLVSSSRSPSVLR